MRKLGRFLFRTSVVIFVANTIIFAGITGKVSGVISDINTGKGLPGVNVILVGTGLGTATDENGAYQILNIPPGQYSIKISMIGYTNVIVDDVQVIIDQTTYLDLKIQEEVVGLNEVVVRAERKYIEPDVSASTLNVSSSDIKDLAVSNINDVIGLQAGIEGLSIRGSFANQTGVYIDGFLANDERQFSPLTTMSLMGISDIQIQSGGLSAEYGNIRSGVINIVTKEGRSDRFQGSIAYWHRPPAPKNFGISPYDPNSYFLRPYLDEEVCWMGTKNGSWDANTQRQYPSFEGWKEVSRASMADPDPKNHLTPEQAKKIFEWQHRRNGGIDKPDVTYDLNFGGPLLPQFLPGNLRFYLSHYSENVMFVFPLSKDSYSTANTRIKINGDIRDNIKLTLIGHYSETQSVSPFNWTTTPTGFVLKTTQDVANLLNGSSGNSILFMPGYFSPTTIYRSGYGIKINHMLSKKSYYDALIQFSKHRYNTYQTEVRDTTRKYEIFDGYYADESPYGYWGYGISGIDGMSMGGWMNLGRERSEISTLITKFDYTNQVNPRNELSLGAEYVQNVFNIDSYTENPSMSTWNRDFVYNVSPYRASLYVQDKLEYEAFVANIGLRGEVSNSNTVDYLLDIYDKQLGQGFGYDIEDSSATKKTKPVGSLSPHLGISFPITETSKLFFNYGHNYSEPASQYRFGLQRESNGLVTNLGNPSLKHERSISYELGFATVLGESFLLSTSAYYKDVTSQIGWIYYQNLNNTVQYRKPSNNNYEDIRGFEITLDKKKGKWIRGFVNYTYTVKTSGYFGLTSYYQDPNQQNQYESTNPYQSKPRPQPYVNSVIIFQIPERFGPKMFNFYPLADWSINTIYTYKAGAYDTYNPDNRPGVLDNVQWVGKSNLDMRLSRKLFLNKMKYTLFVDISNVLNSRYLNPAGFSDYYDYVDYVESLHFSWEEGKEHGKDRLGVYREDNVEYRPFDPVDPDNLTKEELAILETKAYIDMPNLKSMTFLNPRDVRFGVYIEF